jgi:hypothetical protein
MSKHFTRQQILDAISKSHGIVLNVANALGCEWHTAETKINSDPDLIAAMQKSRERMIDIAENVVVDNIEKKADVITSKWFLGIQGKKRGYSDEKILSGNININLSFNDENGKENTTTDETEDEITDESEFD